VLDVKCEHRTERTIRAAVASGRPVEWVGHVHRFIGRTDNQLALLYCSSPSSMSSFRQKR
jgi:hypothetical protein